jgi:glutathione S-transferase
MNQLRIFSYLPNPRIWKATIAARQIRGSAPKELQSWLRDFNASPLLPDEKTASEEVRGRVGFKGALHKTGAFLETHLFGTVPAPFSPDGKVGIFESESIMRAVARLGESKVRLYGRDPNEA